MVLIGIDMKKNNYIIHYVEYYNVNQKTTEYHLKIVLIANPLNQAQRKEENKVLKLNAINLLIL